MKLTVANLLAAVAWIILPLGFVAPKGEAPLFIVAAVAGLVLLWGEGRFRGYRPGHLAIAAVAIGAVALGSTLWSVTPERSLRVALIVVATGVGIAVLARAAAGLPSVVMGRLQSTILVAVGLGLVWLALDLLSGGVIIAAIDSVRGPTLPAGNDPRSMLTNGASIAALVAWPWLAAWANRFGLPAAAAALVALLVVLCFGTADTTPLALLVGMVAAGLTIATPRLARRVVIAGVVIAALATPLLPRSLPDPQIDDPFMSQLSNSGLHRLLIWRNTVDLIATRPMLGFGLDSSRGLYGPETKQEYRLSGKPQVFLSEPIPLHPHNISLQIWLELGALGALAAAAFLVLLARRIFAIRDTWSRAAAVGMLASGLVIANLSYGAWQSWWHGAVGLAAALMVAVARGAGPRDGPEQVYRLPK